MHTTCRLWPPREEFNDISFVSPLGISYCVLLRTSKWSRSSSSVEKLKVESLMMKAVVITTPGGPEVLKLQEVADPELKEDEVLIKVAATALNRADTLQRKGAYPPPPGSSPYLGLECSGTIEAVGEHVSRWQVGDRVIRNFLNFFKIFLCCVCFLWKGWKVEGKWGVMINSVYKDEKKGIWEFSVASGVGGLYIIYH